MTDRIMELVHLIKVYSEEYYSGKATISDIEFDLLVQELREIDPKSAILELPGYGYSPPAGEFKKKHLSKEVGSLDKIKSEDFVTNKKFDPEDNVIVTAKLDGSSAVCYYKYGKLSCVLSRGDGLVGLDITRNVQHSVPLTIPKHKVTELCSIRGEVVLTYEDYEYMDGMDIRNKATGLSQSKHIDQDSVQKLKFIGYSITTNNKVFDKKSQLEKIKLFGFNVAKHVETTWNKFKKNILINSEHYKDLSKTPDNQTLPIDGLVITKNEVSSQEEDCIIYIKEDSIAYKFEDESKESVVLDIEWSLSRTGKMVPVLIIDEIELTGANINRVAANNITWLTASRSGIGARVSIVRSNKVIPYLKKVIEESSNFKIPEICPECGNKLVCSGTDLVCKNSDCPCRFMQIVYNIWESIKPDGAAGATLAIFLNYISKETNPKLILESFRNSVLGFNVKLSDSHTDSLIKVAINEFKEKQITMKELLLQANIPTIGEIKAKKIASSLIEENFASFLLEGKPLGNSEFKEILNNYKNILKLVFSIWGSVFKEEEEIKNNTSATKVSVTGNLLVKRKNWFKALEQFGVVESSINKTTNFLVSNKLSSSSKFRQATSLGIQIVDENTFYEKLSVINNVDVESIKRALLS